MEPHITRRPPPIPGSLPETPKDWRDSVLIAVCIMLGAAILSIGVLWILRSISSDSLPDDQHSAMSQPPDAAKTPDAEIEPEAEAVAEFEPKADWFSSWPFATRVIKASPQQIDLILAVLKEGLMIDPKAVYAVRSSNHARAFYVVTRIYLSEVDDHPTSAAWFITGEPDRPSGMILPADQVAATFSCDEFPRGRDTAAAAWHTDPDCGSLMLYVSTIGYRNDKRQRQ